MLATLTDELGERRKAGEWTTTDELLARVITEIRDLRRDFRTVNGDKHPPPRFEFRRPNEPAPKKSGMADFARAHTGR